MTIITLSTTVGFGEVHELTEAGKIWAIVVIMFGVTGFAILISQLGSYLIEFKQYRNRKMENKIKKCVLTSAGVEYGSDQYKSYAGGRPQTTKLSLSFQELEIITKDYIGDGY